MLTGCDVSEIDSVQKALRAVSSWNDGVQKAIFRANHLAPTFSPPLVMKPPRFNAYYPIEDVKPVDGASWSLELAGRIADSGRGARELYALPEQEIIIRHVCVEGWDYIGQWSGPNLRDFLQRVGADLTAKYVYFICADDYTESIDLPTALHPQDNSRHQICRRDHRRSVRLSVAAAHLDQAWLQERQMDQGDRSLQRIP